MLALILACDPQPTPTTSPTGQVLTPVRLRLHCWNGYAEPFQAAFIAEMARQGYAVSLEIQPATGLDSFMRALQEDTADLITPASDLSPLFLQAGLVQPLDQSRLPHMKEINPLIRQAQPAETRQHLVPFTFGPYALAYNTERTTPPTSYQALWDNRHASRITIADYDTANIYLAALALGMPKESLFSLSDQALAQITHKLRQLKQQQRANYWRENLDPTTAKQYDLGTDWGVGVRQINLNKSDSPWALTIPKEGATAWMDTWMLSAKTRGETLKVAHAFIDFALRADTQAQVARATSYGVVNMYVIRHLSPQEAQAHHLTDPDYLGKLTLWQPLPPQVLARYRQAWRDANSGVNSP